MRRRPVAVVRLRRAIVLLLAVLLPVLAVGAFLLDGGLPGSPGGPEAQQSHAGAGPTAPTRSPTAASSARGAPSAGASTGREAAEYAYPVAGCKSSYARTHHDYPAADIFGDPGCTFVAPVAGRIDAVSRRDHWDPSTNRGATRGGRFVALVGVDGVRYYGSHLAAVSSDIAVGDQVEAGERLGRLGESGSARGTGTHLHLGLSWPTDQQRWWVRRGVIRPQPYLDAWREGRNRSSSEQVRDARRRLGDDMRRCGDYC